MPPGVGEWIKDATSLAALLAAVAAREVPQMLLLLDSVQLVPAVWQAWGDGDHGGSVLLCHQYPASWVIAGIWGH
jgi:hypothetical protein